MTEKHRDPEYIRNAKIVRARVRRAWRLGQDVHCWRTGRILIPGRPFDVGHIDPDGGHSISNLAPESVKSNRSEGGRRGAAITNAARRASRSVPPPRRRSTEGLAPW
ncbi:hypothetical protein [uncultured Microbacterium sp.]|uniref:hypothetical protein n=1 Tax=uncultured Microbacterium sp. TaxID=191216 RepID=UPI00259A7915|nr:hypothetical protein [uncultured Microbacterium sp.]